MVSKLPFNDHTQISADAIYAQVRAALQNSGEELYDTPRKPDVRVIAENTDEETATFKNPGGHSPDLEQIPSRQSIITSSEKAIIAAQGNTAAEREANANYLEEKYGITENGITQELLNDLESGALDEYAAKISGTAAMIMLKGETLAERQANAQLIEDTYSITENGLSKDFLEDLKNGALSEYAAEAYGPAPLEKQANKLDDVSWQNHDGSSIDVTPVKGEHGAFGARPPADETVFAVRIPADENATVDVKGTDTSAEHMLDTGDGYKTIYVGVDPVRDPDNDWQPTGEVTTKPISPDVAQDFYGQYLANIPVAHLDKSGMLRKFELNPAQPDTDPKLVNNPLDNGPGGGGVV